MQYNLINLSILFSLGALVIVAHELFNTSINTCDHDNITHPFYKEFEISYLKFVQIKNSFQIQTLRNLQMANTKPIRITYDITGLDNGSISSDQRNYLIKLIKTIINYSKNLIKVYQSIGNNVFKNGDSTKCFEDVNVQEKDRTIGISNSDLHLYIIYQINSNSTSLADAGWCGLDASFQRPSFGRIRFNLAALKIQGNDANQYQRNLMVVFHEIIHILGFSNASIKYWINPSTGVRYGSNDISKIIQQQTIRGLKTNILSSPNVLQVAKQYYSCQDIQGMQLENQGGDGSFSSHWERTIIMSEIMTSSSLIQALLKDTGFWEDINENMAEEIYWGKNKGCDFVKNGCQSDNKYKEFQLAQTGVCSYQNEGIGHSSTDKYADGCQYIIPYSLKLCQDIDNNGQNYQNERLEVFSYNSKCFESSVINSMVEINNMANTRCHQYQCSQDRESITIFFPQIDSLQLSCGNNDKGSQKKVIYNNKVLGTVICPSDYKMFCGNPNCKNFCSSNGVCVRGYCMCNPGFVGEDCSISCQEGQFLYKDRCVERCPSNTFSNPDNECRIECQNGYYPNQSDNQCQVCDFSCSKCNGPNKNNCTGCQFLTYLQKNTCVQKCDEGYFQNENNKTCEKCDKGCKSCTGASFICSQCELGYAFQQQSQTCNKIICDSNCLTCGLSSTDCTSCKKVLYLNKSINKCVEQSYCPFQTFPNPANNECNSCIQGCLQCSSANSCQKCDQDNNYRLNDQQCTLCQLGCQTCLENNRMICTKCENDLYLLNNICVTDCPEGMFKGKYFTCQQCDKGCKECLVKGICNKCYEDLGYQLYQYKICIQQSDCFEPCQTCEEQFQPKKCLTCIKNYVLQNSTCQEQCDEGYFIENNIPICQKCSDNCLTCLTSSTKCYKCKSQMVRNNNQCLEQCPDQFENINGVCTLRSTDMIQYYSLGNIQLFQWFIYLLIILLIK